MMFPAALSERLDALIDDLIMDGGVETASMASILLAAKDSLKSGSLIALSRKVWAANCELKSGEPEPPGRIRSDGSAQPESGGPSPGQPYCHAG